MNEEQFPPRRTPALDRVLALELARVSEAAAVAAARHRGRGDEHAADQAAVDAMRSELNRLPVSGTVVIGEGERDEAPMLYIGESVGAGGTTRVDIALDPLEGTTICAKNLPNALAVVAIAEAGRLLHAPDVYMQKIAIGPGYAPGTIDLDASPRDNLHSIARAKGVPVGEVAVCVLERPRHSALVEEIRATGAMIRLIGDGDVAAIIDATRPEISGIDVYMGTGGAPEGVLAAAALCCTGGEMEGRLIIDSERQRERAERMVPGDYRRKLTLSDLAHGDVLFAATGVTDGHLLSGVRFGRQAITTHTVVMRSTSSTVRWIRAEHQDLAKFDRPA
ncbi:MAG TPA: class II fructose-bisphosphatase [Bauldia sp.]|nr:class II fructose-bisphosphatase [Bauldia sp.]